MEPHEMQAEYVHKIQKAKELTDELNETIKRLDELDALIKGYRRGEQYEGTA